MRAPRWTSPAACWCTGRGVPADRPFAPEAVAPPEPVPFAPGGAAEVHSHTAALVLLGLLALVWGVHWVVVKEGLAYVPPLTYAAARVAIGLVTMTALLAWQGRLRRPERANAPIIASIGLVQIAAGVVIQSLALQVVAAGRSAVLLYTMPLWVALILAAVFGIRPRRNELVGLVLGIGGLFLLLNPAVIDWGVPGELLGTLGLLVNAVLWAGTTIHVRRHRWTQSLLELQPWQLLVALVPLAVVAVAVEGGRGIRWEPFTVGALLYSGVLATAFATWASQAITRSLGSQASATGFLAIPIVGLASGWLLLGERLGPADVVGFGLVLGGVAATSLLPDRRS